MPGAMHDCPIPGACAPPLLRHGVQAMSRDVIAVYRKSKEFPLRELALFQG